MKKHGPRFKLDARELDVVDSLRLMKLKRSREPERCEKTPIWQSRQDLPILLAVSHFACR